jgi:hypothetical protein
MRGSALSEQQYPLAYFVLGDTDAAPQSRTGHIRDRGYVLCAYEKVVFTKLENG